MPPPGMSMLQSLEKYIDRFSRALGAIASFLLLLLLLNVFYDVIMRYLFNDVSIGFQELEWHLYAIIFMLGVSYALNTEGHVRVDLFYDKLSPKRQAIIDIAGVIIFILPFALLVFWYSLDFVLESYSLGERSGDPGGLPYRWLIKSIIPLAFISIVISGFGMLVKSVLVLQGKKNTKEHTRGCSP